MTPTINNDFTIKFMNDQVAIPTIGDTRSTGTKNKDTPCNVED